MCLSNWQISGSSFDGVRFLFSWVFGHYGMATEGKVRSVSGKDIGVRPDTLCLHGDQPNALLFAQRIRAELERAGVTVAAPGNER